MQHRLCKRLKLTCACRPGLHRQLSDRASPLYRSLSEIPTGLPPIRTSSRLDHLGEDSESASSSAPPAEPRVPKPKQPRLSGGGGRLSLPADLVSTGLFRSLGVWGPVSGWACLVHCLGWRQMLASCWA